MAQPKKPAEGPNKKLAKQIVFRQKVTFNAERWMLSRLKEYIDQARQLALDVVSAADRGKPLEQVELMLIQLETQYGKLAQEAAEELKADLKKVLDQEYKFYFDALRGVLPKELRRDVVQGTGVPVDVLEVPVHGVDYRTAIERLFDRYASAIDRQVRDAWARSFQRAIEQGFSVREAATLASKQAEELGLDVKQVRELFDDRAMRDLSLIVHCHTAAAIDQAARQVWRENQHLLKGLQHVATWDFKTCEQCAQLDGKIWYYEPEPGLPSVEEMPPLPLHPNCRCTRVPVLKEGIDPYPPSRADYVRWREEAEGKLPKTARMTPREALDEYKNYAYWPINDALRSSKGWLAQIDPEIRGLIENIDKMFSERDRLKKGIIVYRGVDQGLVWKLFEENKVWEQLGLSADKKITVQDLITDPEVQKLGGRIGLETKLTKLLQGVEFVDYGYMSTTRDREVATRFAVPMPYLNKYGLGAVMEISVPPGVKVLDVEKYTGLNSDEKELLLPRGCRLRLDQVRLETTPDGKRMYLYITASVVEEGLGAGQPLGLLPPKEQVDRAMQYLEQFAQKDWFAVNKRLRGEKTLYEERQEDVQSIDLLFSAKGDFAPRKLYRGAFSQTLTEELKKKAQLGEEFALRLEDVLDREKRRVLETKLKEKLCGIDLVDRGFVFTTRKISDAVEHVVDLAKQSPEAKAAEYRQRMPVVFVIDTGAGRKVLDLEKLVGPGFEDTLVLERKLVYRIKDVKVKTKTGASGKPEVPYLEVYVEVVGRALR